MGYFKNSGETVITNRSSRMFLGEKREPSGRAGFKQGGTTSRRCDTLRMLCVEKQISHHTKVPFMGSYFETALDFFGMSGIAVEEFG